MTTLAIEGSPMIRLDTGDVVRQLPRCACGDPRPAIVVLGRRGEEVRVAGRDLYPYELIEAAASAADALDSSVFCTVSVGDCLVVRIEVDEGRDSPERIDVARAAHRSVPMRGGNTRLTREAVDRGFEHVLVNVGSLEADEDTQFLDWIPRRDDGRLAPHVTMCTFQETYDPRLYAKFMGSTEGNPRCDHQRRLENFDRAAEAGFRSANPGILVGLNPDLASELLCLCAHVRHLHQIGLQVYISLPRLRKASGTSHARGASDDTLIRLAALLAAAFVDAKVVISTREEPEVQHRLLEAIGVLTPGSPGVAPYDEADAVFDVDASQLDVADKRPFEDILADVRRAGFVIDGFVPAGAARDDRASMRES